MSLAAQLAAKAKQKSTDPNAPPLRPEDADLDRLAIAAQLEAMKSLPEAPPGSYRALRQHQLILESGKAVFPTNGFYVPTSQEEYDLLEYFDQLNQGLVEKVPQPDAE